MGTVRQSDNYHVVVPKFYTEEECDFLCDLILKESDRLIEELDGNRLKAPNEGNGYTGLTALHSSFNWIPLIEERMGINLMERMMNEIDTSQVDNLYIKSWCNLWKTGEGITPHRHAALEFLDPNKDITLDITAMNKYRTVPELVQYEELARNHMISANVFLSKNDHREYGTWYDVKGGTWIENIRGDLHLFSPLTVHSVDSNTRPEPRMSQAFDIHLDGYVGGYNELSQGYTLDPISVYDTEEALHNFLHVQITHDETEDTDNGQFSTPIQDQDNLMLNAEYRNLNRRPENKGQRRNLEKSTRTNTRGFKKDR